MFCKNPKEMSRADFLQKPGTNITLNLASFFNVLSNLLLKRIHRHNLIVRRFYASVLTLSVLMGQATVCWAETVYVRDTLYVPLRGGQSAEHRILHRGLKSGTKLELLQTVEETGFSQVRMENDVVGWIKTQYLTNQPIAADLLSALQKEHSELKTLHEKTLLRLQTLEADQNKLSQSQQDVTSENARLQQKLDDITTLAANVIATDEENKRLKGQQQDQNAEIEALIKANNTLQDGENRNWFLIGAGVVFGGLLIGFWIARQLYNRRGNSSWA